MKLSLLDHAKLILAFALAFVATMSFHRTAQLRAPDLGSVHFADGMIIALILAAFARAFIRSGPRRAAAMEALVLGAALSFLMLLAWQGSRIVPEHLRGGGAKNLDGDD